MTGWRDGAGNPVWSSDGATFRGTPGVPAFISVQARPYNSGTYVYRLEDLGLDDHGDTEATATPVVVGDRLRARVQWKEDWDYFKLDALAGHSYRLTLAPRPPDPWTALFGTPSRTQQATVSTTSSAAIYTVKVMRDEPLFITFNPSDTLPAEYEALLEDLGN